jgi:hypothetical protein
VGRWCIGLALGWRALDAADGGAPAGILRLELGVATIIGFFLGAITAVSFVKLE